MKLHLESEKIEITCLSPVHVGSGEILNKSQYAYNSRAGKVYFPDESRWVQLISSKRLIPVLAREINTIYDLYTWCNKNRITDAELAQISRVISTSVGSELNDICLCMSDARNLPYIPGSSIKGALRTAILHRLIGAMTTGDKQRYWQSIEQVTNTAGDRAGALKGSLARVIGDLEREQLHCLNRTNRRDNALNSAMQGLRISDAVIVEGGNSATCLIKKTDRHFSGTDKPMPVIRECLVPGTKLQFTMTIEPEITRLIGIGKIEDVLSMARDFTQHIMMRDKKYFGGQWEETKQGNIVIGGGTGFVDKTLLYSLAPSEDAGIETVRKILNIVFNRHSHMQEDKKISPRKLKLGLKSGKAYRMGLCRMEIV